ncbi:hypothetical protein N431DRAFT_456584 [Stipitochalara longipes BDJ]|nr:hypothetical protein N431DRAFT_456584 [Stipitochalara longipes BDJ]
MMPNVLAHVLPLPRGYLSLEEPPASMRSSSHQPSQGNSLTHQTSQLAEGHKRQSMLATQLQTNVGIEAAVNMGVGQKNHAQLEFLMKALHEETISHNATRENLVAFRNAAWRWERSAIYEQSEHRSMAEKFQLGEYNRNMLEERLRNLQTDFDQMAATLALRASHEIDMGEPDTPASSGYESRSFSPSFSLPLLKAGTKRTDPFIYARPSGKRILTSPVTPVAHENFNGANFNM